MHCDSSYQHDQVNFIAKKGLHKVIFSLKRVSKILILYCLDLARPHHLFIKDA